jgi:hypothetical protein
MWMSDQTLWTTRRFLWTDRWTALWITSLHFVGTQSELLLSHPPAVCGKYFGRVAEFLAREQDGRPDASGE